MNLKWLVNSIQYDTPDSGTGVVDPVITGNKGNETIDLVDDLDYAKDKVDEIELKSKTDESEKKEDEEVDELQELEDEIKEPTDDDLELVTPSTRRQILKDYPELFKKHPSLEKSFYRDQKFTEVFEHPKEAVEAKELLDTYSKFEDDVQKGDLSTIIGSVKETSPESYNQIIDNFLPMLEQIDRNAWLNVISNVTDTVLQHAFAAGKNSNDEDLQEAAKIVYKFLLPGDYKPTKLAKNVKTEKSDKEIELERREKEFNDRTLSTAKNDVESNIDRVIKTTISKNIDPKESMSEYIKKNAIRDAYEMYQEQLKNDSSFQKLLDRFWDAAKKSNYSRTSLDRITEAHKNKASALLGKIILKVKNDALKSTRSSKKDDDDTSDKEDRPRRVVARPHNDGPSVEDRGKRVIPKGMTTAEWLSLKD